MPASKDDFRSVWLDTLRDQDGERDVPYQFISYVETYGYEFRLAARTIVVEFPRDGECHHILYVIPARHRIAYLPENLLRLSAGATGGTAATG